MEYTDGPLGTETIGVYDDEATINVDDPFLVAPHAQWLVAWALWRGTATRR